MHFHDINHSVDWKHTFTKVSQVNKYQLACL